MMTKDNFKDVLQTLGFQANGMVYTQLFTALEQRIKAAQAVMDGAAARKAAIVKRYL